MHESPVESISCVASGLIYIFRDFVVAFVFTCRASASLLGRRRPTPDSAYRAMSTRHSKSLQITHRVITLHPLNVASTSFFQIVYLVLFTILRSFLRSTNTIPLKSTPLPHCATHSAFFALTWRHYSVKIIAYKKSNASSQDSPDLITLILNSYRRADLNLGFNLNDFTFV